VLNESPPRAAIDWYLALDKLVADGDLLAYEVIPYLALMADGLDAASVGEQVAIAVERTGADLVLWAHTAGLQLSDSAIARVRSATPQGVMGYWDGDWYHWYHNPFPREIYRLCSQCDVAFLQGDGWLVRSLQRRGCRDVRYVAATSDDRFQPQPARQHYDFDLALIGNKITSRLPFKDLPGNAFRRRLITYFERRLGRRFAIFGEGWTGPSAQGPLPFERQATAYGMAAAALGCNNWFTRYYFSNRLPISMSSARPVIHLKDDGYDEVFGRDPGVFWFHDVEEAWRQFHLVMDHYAEAQEAAQRAEALARQHFTTYHAVSYMVRVLGSLAASREGQRVSLVPNPWIGRERLSDSRT
jgi:hypothetical protein